MKALYKGPLFEVQKIENKDVVVHPGAAVILPLLEPGVVLMIKNKRVAVGKTLWELPAGTVDPDEMPLVTAKRELEEETGYKAKELKPITEFYTSPGYSNEKVYAFLAEEVRKTKQNLEPGEEIEVVPMKWTHIIELIKNEEIQDAKTLAVLMHYILFYY